MADPRLLAPSPADVLMRDHDRIRHLFAEYSRLSPEQSEARERLVRQIRHDLRLHATIEREHFYPAISAAPDLHEDHLAMEGLLDKLSGTKVADKSYDALLKLLEENFSLHAAVEERDLFPQLERLSPLSRRELTMKLESARDRHEQTEAD
ncbi:MAG TPA: hemerythrin domain-containing protein [Planctomycetota bacterium]|nr:hemerythrin domain-containing protein [Planctomycetota bacterium]